PRPRRPREEDEDDRPIRARQRRYEDDDIPPDDDEPPRRPRKKRRRRRYRQESSSATADLFGDVNPVWVSLIVLGVVWIICFGIVFVFPALAILPVFLGGLVAFASYIWFLVLVFQDDIMAGILCL